MGLVTITEDPTTTGVSGFLPTGGSASHSVPCALEMAPGMFDLLYNYVSTSHPGMNVELTYDDVSPFPVSDLICGVTQSAFATEATSQAIHMTAQAIQASLGPGNISGNLEALNHTAQALLHAITHATRIASRQQRFLDSDPPAATDSDPPPRLDSALDSPKAS